ncbi:MAG: CehA/McbA family metallohydrolase, partial [Thermoplasmata archaeon]
MSGSLRLDMHVHSVHSPDSRLTLETIVELLGPRGLQGFALTDHNTVDGHVRLHELQRRFPRYLFIPGVEVSTADGHLLAYGITSPPPRDRPVAETARWVADHGGVSVLAHPYRAVHGVGDKIAQTVQVTGL